MALTFILADVTALAAGFLAIFLLKVDAIQNSTGPFGGLNGCTAVKEQTRSDGVYPIEVSPVVREVFVRNIGR